MKRKAGWRVQREWGRMWKPSTVKTKFQEDLKAWRGRGGGAEEGQSSVGKRQGKSLVPLGNAQGVGKGGEELPSPCRG